MPEIKIRQDHENGYDIDLATAIAVARDGKDTDGHRASRVVVTLVYSEDTDGGKDYRGQRITHKAGEYVFGRQIEIYARGTRFGAPSDAYISWASSGSMTPADATVWGQMLTTATTIAAEANRPAKAARCPACGAAEGEEHGCSLEERSR
jgi:hypothetical protein